MGVGLLGLLAVAAVLRPARRDPARISSWGFRHAPLDVVSSALSYVWNDDCLGLFDAGSVA